MEGYVIKVNDSYKDMMGYNEDELRKLKYDDFTPEKWHAFERKIITEQVLDKGYSDLYEKEFIRNDGTIIPVELSVYLIKDAQGSNSGMRAIVKDITDRKQAEDKVRKAYAEVEKKVEERTIELSVANADLAAKIAEHKRAEKALQESEKKFRAIYENIQDVYYQTDMEGKLVMISPSVSASYGFDNPEKLIGCDIAESFYYHPEERKKTMEEIMKTGCVKNFQVTLKRRDGTPVPTEINAHIIYDEVGNIAGTEGIARDVSEQKQAEGALRNSEERYSSIVENSLNAIIVYEQKDILFANEAFFKVFGYDRKELEGIVVDDILSAEVVEATAELRRRRMAGVTKKSTVYETKARRKDGEIFYIEISVCLVPYRNKLFCMAFLSDIDRRKQAENELANKTKSLEETNVALNILLKKRERDKKDIEERVVSNVKMMVEPYLRHLRKKDLDNGQITAMDLIESGLNEIVSSFSVKLSSKHLGLTPGELRVAYLIKEGKRTKDIADLLNLSTKTIEGFRKNLRKKFGLTNTKMNLRTHLISIQ